MEGVTLSRKERIMKEKEKYAAVRKKKIQIYTVAGTLATSIMLSVNSAKALGCNDVYEVQKGDTLYSLAKKYNVSVEQIKNANGLTSEMIMAGQELEVPAVTGPHTHEGQPFDEKTEKNLIKHTYTVQHGDTLYSLAKRYGVEIEQIQKGNGLTSASIKSGQSLEIPALNDSNTAQKAEEVKSEKTTFVSYTVSPGENLWSIAKKFNTSLSDLRLYNNLTSDAILIGQKLVIKSDSFIKTTATVVGAADSFSVEFMINGEPKVLQVAYGTFQQFGDLSGKQVEIVYHQSRRPALVSYK